MIPIWHSEKFKLTFTLRTLLVVYSNVIIMRRSNKNSENPVYSEASLFHFNHLALLNMLCYVVFLCQSGVVNLADKLPASDSPITFCPAASFLPSKVKSTPQFSLIPDGQTISNYLNQSGDL